MKPHFTFLLIFLFLLGFGQTNEGFIRDSLRRVQKEKENIQYEKDIIKDFENVEYESLIKKIMNDIDFRKLPQKNIFFYYRNCSYDVARILIDLDTASEPNINVENPAFNQQKFWTFKTLMMLCRKTHKNFIPILDSYEIEDVDQFKRTLRYHYSKKDPFLFLLDYFKKGELILNNEDKLRKGVLKKEFYYFSTKKNNLEIVKKEIKDYEDFGGVQIEFKNKLNKIVEVVFNYDHYDFITKTYQYQNKKWIEIPTKDEYKF